jgi:hypothetical protein
LVNTVYQQEPDLSMSKLTIEIAKEIREKAEDGYRQTVLAKEYEVTQSVISDIINNEMYKDPNYIQPEMKAFAKEVFARVMKEFGLKEEKE